MSYLRGILDFTHNKRVNAYVAQSARAVPTVAVLRTNCMPLPPQWPVAPSWAQHCPLMNRLSERAQRRPAAFKPLGCRALVEAEFITQIRKRSSGPKHCHFGSRPLVALLLLASSPSTITRLVIAKCVDAINCAILWALTHVRQKIHKFPPPLTDRNSKGAVTSKIFRCRRVAAIHHCKPRPICRSSGFSVGSVFAPRPIPGVTATRMKRPTSEQAIPDNSDFPAVANTLGISHPSSTLPATRRRISNHQQSVEFLTNKGNGLFHT